jgi:hypothetical protein
MKVAPASPEPSNDPSRRRSASLFGEEPVEDEVRVAERQSRGSRGSRGSVTMTQSIADFTRWTATKEYVDDDASGPVGVLLFHLELGHELTAADRNGLSDPYCIVKVAQNPLWRSRICRRTLEPNWDQLHAFEGFLRVCRDRARTADWL